MGIGRIPPKRKTLTTLTNVNFIKYSARHFLYTLLIVEA